MRRSDCWQSGPDVSRDIDETLPSIPEENGRADHLPARGQTKKKKK